MQQLNNPVYLGLIIAAMCLLTSVLIPIVIYLKQRSKKEISYRVITDVPLLNIKDEVKENFEVRFRGEPVSNATFVSVKVWNSGNAPIEEADFIDPIELSFGDNAKIIFSSTGSEPDNILSRYESVGEKGYVTYKPRLFNKGYLFEVTVMVTDFCGTVKAEGLVKGVHSIKNANFPSVSSLTTPSWKRIFMYSILAGETSLFIAAFSLLNSFGPNFFTTVSGFPASAFQFITLIILLGVVLSGLSALEIYLSMRTNAIVTQFDDAYIKHIFSLLQAKIEEESHKQTAQQAVQTNPPSSGAKKISKPTT